MAQASRQLSQSRRQPCMFLSEDYVKVIVFALILQLFFYFIKLPLKSRITNYAKTECDIVPLFQMK